MAQGDAVGHISSVNAAGTLEIRPDAGVEWIIHNIYHEAEVELYVSDSANNLLFDSAAVKGSWSGHFFHITNTQWLKVYNTNAGSKLMGYDGIVSKE